MSPCKFPGCRNLAADNQRCFDHRTANTAHLSIDVPRCPNYVAHPQAVWFEEHWKPIIEAIQSKINTLTTDIKDMRAGLDLAHKDLWATVDENKRLRDEVNELSGVIVILKDDADFFTGDVRELTAWGRVKDAYDKYALADAEPDGSLKAAPRGDAK